MKTSIKMVIGLRGNLPMTAIGLKVKEKAMTPFALLMEQFMPVVGKKTKSMVAQSKVALIF